MKLKDFAHAGKNKMSGIFKPVSHELELVERQISSIAASGLPPGLVKIPLSGGKRLRPGLLLLAGKYGLRSGPVLTRLGAALETLHVATLTHDDILDRAVTRRGLPTIYKSMGTNAAILMGDYYFAEFLGLAAPYGPVVLSRLAAVLRDLVTAELMQQRAAFNTSRSEEDYYHTTACKSATFTAAACWLGARVTGAPRKFCDALELYGYSIGMSFQITDDLLDFCGRPEHTGKPVGQDYRRGVYTLPIIYALNNPVHGEELKTLLQNPDTAANSFNAILAILDQTGALEYTRRAAEKFAGIAKKSLSILPGGDVKESLHILADFLLCREY